MYELSVLTQRLLNKKDKKFIYSPVSLMPVNILAVKAKCNHLQ